MGLPLLNFIFAKNLYCSWVCPFGAAQEFTGKFTGAKLRCSEGIKQKLKKLKYISFYLVLLLAFFLHTPSVANFEPFAVLFGQDGYGVQWLLMPLILLAALFVNRFWCNYFCPVGVANEFVVGLGRKLRNLLRSEEIPRNCSPCTIKEGKVDLCTKESESKSQDKILIVLVIGIWVLILIELYQGIVLNNLWNL
ncbi:MAG: 4Fe-4S binding protein [Desulfitobacterium sp.]|nr:4Fe-4S binding protein [Desulfitobacterium sp.]